MASDNVIEITIVDRVLQRRYNDFMHELMQDIERHLGENVPFVVKIDFSLGADRENTEKLFKYHRILQKMMNDLPKPKEKSQ